MEEMKKGEMIPGQTANKDKQAQVMATASEAAHWERVGKASEAINKYAMLHMKDYHLTHEEMAQAIYLEVINWKEFWPTDLGGPAQFDALSKDVWDWFQANKNK
jgi:hypothetical protein